MSKILDSNELGKKSLVCSLDILGYRNFVENNTSDISNRNSIPKTLEIFENVLATLKKEDALYEGFITIIKIQMISDTIIFVLEIPSEDQRNTQLSLEECLKYFFKLISLFFIFFYCKNRTFSSRRNRFRQILSKKDWK